jgi:hemolysin activation/secretion protein
MKKILVTLLVVSSMVFALTAAAMANSVYVDGLVNGKEKAEGNEPGYGSYNEKYDSTSYALGANLNAGKFLFNLEYAKNKIENADPSDPTDEDTKSDTINFKVGYTLFGDEQSYLALTAGYYQEKIDDSDNSQNNGTILGLKAATNLNEKALLEGSAGYSVSGTSKADHSKDEDIDILLLQVKYSYFFTENFGLGVGYKLTQYKGDNDSKETMSGPTVGLTYKF